MSGTVFVIVGGPCNNRCADCDVASARRPDTRDLAKMLSLAARRGCDRAVLTGGEPTMRQDLGALLAIASRLGIEAVLCTNARLLSHAANASLLASLGVREIEVRLLGPDAASHDALAGAPAFAETVAGVRNALAAGVRVRAVVMAVQGRLDGLRDSVRLALGLGVSDVAVRLSDRPPFPSLREAGRAVEDAIAGVDGATCEGFPCCVVPRLKGREGVNPRRHAQVLLAEDGIRFVEPRPSARSVPLPCVRCELLDGCPTLSPGHVEAGGAADLFPPTLTLRGVVFRPSGVLPDFRSPGCPYAASPDAPRPGPDRLILAHPGGGYGLYEAVDGTFDNLALVQVKNARQAVLGAGGRTRFSLVPECRECLLLSRCAGCFREEGSCAPGPEGVRLAAGDRVAAPLLWADFGQAMAEFVREAGGATMTLSGTAPHVLLDDGENPCEPGFDAGTVEPWVAWEAIRRVAPVGLEDYRLPIDGPGFELVFSEAAGPSQDGKLGTIFILKSCTMDCIICSVRRFYTAPGDRATMPLPDVFRLMEEFRLLGYDRLDLFGGEPTMRPDLSDMLRFARRLGFYNDMITNGSLLTPALAMELRDAGLDLCMVSLDGPTPATHDRIRRTPGGYDRAVAGIRAAVAAGGMEVSIDTVVLPENLDELEDLARLAVDLGVSRLNLFLCLEGPISSPVPRLLGFERTVEFYADILPRMAAVLEPAGVVLSVAPGLPVGPDRVREFAQDPIFRDLCHGVYNPIWRRSEALCTQPDREIFVSLRGDVFPCTAPQILETDACLGNVWREPLVRVVRSSAAREFRRVAGHADGCRMCWRASFDLGPAAR